MIGLVFIMAGLTKRLPYNMPRIVTFTFPALATAQANTQIEFESQQ